MIQIIEKNWLTYFLEELKVSQEVLIISPFITSVTVDHLLEKKNINSTVRIITRFNLNDFRSKVSSLNALKKLVKNGVKMKGIKELHSKMYVFDNRTTIIGSANFTSGGFFNNYEYGIKTDDQNIVLNSKDYFEKFWQLDSYCLTIHQIQLWEEILKESTPIKIIDELPDFGFRASVQGNTNRNYFIKFFGKANNRVNLNFETETELERTQCHWALTFSGKKGRPRKYKSGDIVYMARMLEGNDYAIFGKGIAIKHQDARDIASIEDIKFVNWKSEWPIYIRVKETEFINGKMKNCPKMSELIDALKYESFYNTQRKHLLGENNINVRDSLKQQADVKLSEISAEWLENKFQEAKYEFGEISKNFINSLYAGSPTLKEIENKA